jgi:hypothetical protein
LREADIVFTSREGRNIFYHLRHTEVIEILFQSAKVAGITGDELDLIKVNPVPGCGCPHCNPDRAETIVC